jgi:hypothetical protein
MCGCGANRREPIERGIDLRMIGCGCLRSWGLCNGARISILLSLRIDRALWRMYSRNGWWYYQHIGRKEHKTPGRCGCQYTHRFLLCKSSHSYHWHHLQIHQDQRDKATHTSDCACFGTREYWHHRSIHRRGYEYQPRELKGIFGHKFWWCCRHSRPCQCQCLHSSSVSPHILYQLGGRTHLL